MDTEKTNGTDALMKLDELSCKSGISLWTLRKMARTGALMATKLGRSWWVPRSEARRVTMGAIL